MTPIATLLARLEACLHSDRDPDCRDLREVIEWAKERSCPTDAVTAVNSALDEWRAESLRMTDRERMHVEAFARNVLKRIGGGT